MPLRSLAEQADLTLPAGAFDVRGWDVITRVDDEKVGEVDDVLADDEGEPRYLDVDLGLLQKHVLLPLEHARVDEAADVVWVPGMTKDRFQHVPAYTHDPGTITSEYEALVGEAYAAAYADERHYGRPEHSTERSRTAGTTGIGDRHLASLDELEGFEVAHGDPDPRGWDVLSSDGKTVGAVSELIIDTSALKVRYLDCDLDEDALGLEDRDRHILIPAGYARLDEERERVIVDAISSSNIQALPPFMGLPLEHEFEEHLHTGFTRGLGSEPRYEHPRSRKRLVEEEEEVEADLRHERLDVERHGDIEEEEGRGQER